MRGLFGGGIIMLFPGLVFHDRFYTLRCAGSKGKKSTGIWIFVFFAILYG